MLYLKSLQVSIVVFCPDGHVIGQGLHDANPNDVFLINIHTGGYSNPNGPNDPDFNTIYGAAIGTASGLAGYPAGTVNRATFSGDFSSRKSRNYCFKNYTHNHQHMLRHLMDGALGLEYAVTTAGTFCSKYTYMDNAPN